MWGSTELEAVQVGLDSIDFNTESLGAGLKHVRVVNCKGATLVQIENSVDTIVALTSLSTGDNLLTAHENVVRVGVSVVLSIEHCVEGSNGTRELVDDKEVSLVLLLDNATQQLFSGGREIIEISHLDLGVVGLIHQLDGLRECQTKFLELEGLVGELVADCWIKQVNYRARGI